MFLPFLAKPPFSPNLVRKKEEQPQASDIDSYIGLGFGQSNKLPWLLLCCIFISNWAFTNFSNTSIATMSQIPKSISINKETQKEQKGKQEEF